MLSRRIKKTLKWAGYLFFTFLACLYILTLRKGTPYPGAVVFLMLVSAGAAYWTYRSLDRDEVEEGAQLDEQEWLESVKHDTLMLAMEHDGVLTVTDVATDLDIPLADAERVLTSMDDGVRVASSVTEDGVIVYEFKEVIHRQARMRGAASRAENRDAR
ncbi:hypothetical protein [Longimicrobium sp.]|uniref:hypothetical protein n=1 Tax=Longimicrobium sp. TaxID=2029185 RepID=UPI003B3A87D5